jgi:hypothetical protein
VRTAARAVLGACAAAAALCGCDNPGVHVYSGQLFDMQGQCVQPTSTALDVVSGAATGNACPAACLVGSTQVYVSTVCPPYPAGYNVETLDAGLVASDPCSVALTAFAAGMTCGAAGDGGTGDDGGAADAPADAPGDGP